MGYVEQNLVTGETVTYRTRLHWIILFWPVVVLVLLGIPGLFMVFRSFTAKAREGMGPIGFVLLVVGVLPLIWASLVRRAAEFAVTNKRVILKAGVVHRKTLEIFLNKIESVGVDQSILGRVLGYGSIVVHGTGGSAEPFDRIARPLEFRHQVQEQIGRNS